MKKQLNVVSTIIVVLSVVGVLIFEVNSYIVEKKKIKKMEKIEEKLIKKEKEAEKINLVSSHYKDSVIVNKDSNLYLFYKDKFVESGKVYKNTILHLDSDIKIDHKTEYFKLENSNYYIKYNDVERTEESYQKDMDYKNYIPFDENVITNGVTKLYNDDDSLAFEINSSIDSILYIKDGDKYYIEFANKLYYVKKSKVKLEKRRTNDKALAYNIAVLTYHFFYNASKGNDCKQIICLSDTKFDEQMKYLKDNNYYTATMKAFELWIDKKIRLPKNTVVLTIDDGYRQEDGYKILEKYGLHATLFLVTSWNLPNKYNTNVYEYHSHSHDMHNTGVCPIGQGGGIQCLPKNQIISDLKKSQELLNGTTVFCYPFYEYNNYSITALKEAGYKMAFTGGMEKVYQGHYKYTLPRYTILEGDSLSKFISYIK